MSTARALLLGLVAVAAAAAELTVGDGPALIVAGILVAAGPGVVIASLFGDRLGIDGLGRGVLGTAGSLGICVLGAFLLNATGGLTRTSWTLLLSTITLLGAAAMPVRHRQGSAGRALSVAVRRGRVSPRTVLLALAAVGLASGAVVLSVTSDLHRAAPTFSELWLVPHLTSADTHASAQLGVRNDEGRSTTYRLVLRRAGEPTERWTFRLRSGAARTWMLSLGAREPVAADLYRAVDGRWPTTPYRRVHAVARWE